MDVFKKIFIGIFIISILCNIIAISIYFNKSGEYQATITDSANTIAKLEKQLEAEKSRYRELENLNQSIKERLIGSINKSERAETATGTIQEGLSRDIERVDNLIKIISDIIEQIELLGKEEQDIRNDSYSNGNSSNN